MGVVKHGDSDTERDVPDGVEQLDDGEVPADDGEPSIHSDSFKTRGVDVRVSNAAGFLCKVKMKAVIDMPPEEVFQVFTNPDNANVFRAVDSISRHEILHSDAATTRAYVEQVASVGLLWFKHQFTTALYVTEHTAELRTSFELAKPGMMRAFRGEWTLAPVRNTEGGWPETRCIARLEQDVEPAIVKRVPAILHGFLRRVCAATCLRLLEDLRVVAKLRGRGISMPEILRGDIHGRNGLRARHLRGVDVNFVMPLGDACVGGHCKHDGGGAGAEAGTAPAVTAGSSTGGAVAGVGDAQTADGAGERQGGANAGLGSYKLTDIEQES